MLLDDHEVDQDNCRWVDIYSSLKLFRKCVQRASISSNRDYSSLEDPGSTPDTCTKRKITKDSNMKKVENLYSRNSRQNSLTISVAGSLLRALRLEVTFFSAKNNRGPGKRERRRSRKDRMEKPERKTFFVVTIFWKTKRKQNVEDSSEGTHERHDTSQRRSCVYTSSNMDTKWMEKRADKGPGEWSGGGCVCK